MYFVIEGTIGVGFSLIQPGIMNNNYMYSQKQKGRSMIGGHYVINKQRSQFIYAAVDNTVAYGIKASHLHQTIFSEFQEFYSRVKSSTYNYYKHWVYRPIMKHKEREIDKVNSKNFIQQDVSGGRKRVMKGLRGTQLVRQRSQNTGS